MPGLFGNQQLVCLHGWKQDVSGGPLRFNGGREDKGLESQGEVSRFYPASMMPMM